MEGHYHREDSFLANYVGSSSKRQHPLRGHRSCSSCLTLGVYRLHVDSIRLLPQQQRETRRTPVRYSVTTSFRSNRLLPIFFNCDCGCDGDAILCQDSWVESVVSDGRECGGFSSSCRPISLRVESTHKSVPDRESTCKQKYRFPCSFDSIHYHTHSFIGLVD